MGEAFSRGFDARVAAVAVSPFGAVNDAVSTAGVVDESRGRQGVLD